MNFAKNIRGTFLDEVESARKQIAEFIRYHRKGRFRGAFGEVPEGSPPHRKQGSS
jgi:hypothetical protein